MHLRACFLYLKELCLFAQQLSTHRTMFLRVNSKLEKILRYLRALEKAKATTYDHRNNQTHRHPKQDAHNNVSNKLIFSDQYYYLGQARPIFPNEDESDNFFTEQAYVWCQATVLLLVVTDQAKAKGLT